MKNYICINGKKVKLTEEQVNEIKVSYGLQGVKLSDIPVGEPFKLGKHEFVVLEHSGDTTSVTYKGLLIESKKFGSNNNFDGSNVDTECQKFAGEIAGIVGAENIIEHTVDLTSDDGLKDYGKVKRKMSLLTADLYRRYVYILDKFKLDKWWWLATAYSTKAHDNDRWVKCVSPSGIINSINCDGICGVRPFCILNSSIFVSK